MVDDVAINLPGYDKRSLMDEIWAGVDVVLAQSSWICSTKIEMLQAIVIYLISVCREEVSCAHSNIVAAAIRAAECLGLHKDGAARSYSAVQIQVRRLLWHQLLLLDIRTSEATGPRPHTREGDFSTKLPLNIDEHMVHLSSNDSTKWTDVTVTVIRMKCNEFIREMWTDRMRLQGKQTTISEVLAKIQAFDAYMQGSYGKMANMKLPIQRYGCLVAKILTLRTYAMILHQYALHPRIEMPDALKKPFIEHGIEAMDAVQDLETNADFTQWRWIAGAIQQHHYALAMLVEYLKDPFMGQAMALLRGLEYVFEPPRHLSLKPLIWVRYVVIEIQNRMKFYVAQRKPCAPRSHHDPGEVLESEVFEPSPSSSPACTSIMRRNASPTRQESMSSDDQSGSHPSTYPDISTSEPIISSVSADLSQQSWNDLQWDVMDMDMLSSRQVFPDILNTEFTMSSDNTSKTFMTGRNCPHIPKQGQLLKGRAAHNSDLDNAPQSDGSSNTPIGKCNDERVPEIQFSLSNTNDRDSAPSKYDFATIPSIFQMPATAHSSISPTYTYTPTALSTNFHTNPATQIEYSYQNHLIPPTPNPPLPPFPNPDLNTLPLDRNHLNRYLNTNSNTSRAATTTPTLFHPPPDTLQDAAASPNHLPYDSTSIPAFTFTSEETHQEHYL